MKSKRIKATAPAIQTRAEMETLVGEIATLVLAEKKIKTRLENIIQRVREKFKARLLQIQSLYKAKFKQAEDWARRHPGEFIKPRSIEMMHATVGYRKGNFAVEILEGWTEEKAIAAIKRVPKFAHLYVRQVEEIYREGLIADRSILSEKELREVGIKIAQGEKFFVEPKEEKVTPPAVAEKET
jgi:phage host-nuclease inhibitor protein Gam